MAAVLNSPDITHIVYLAIEDGLRGCGYGSRALELLHDFYYGKRMMVDIELPDGTSENESQRVQRKQFLYTCWIYGNICEVSLEK